MTSGSIAMSLLRATSIQSIRRWGLSFTTCALERIALIVGRRRGASKSKDGRAAPNA